MKTSITAKTSLNPEVESKLNKQVRMEGISAFYYLSMASWCENRGFVNAAEFLYDHFEEEKMHMLKLMRYINEAGGHAIAPEITNLRYEYGSFREVFDQILEHEIAVSRAINNLADFCFKEKDFASFQFLQWYVAEQREEESVARRLVELFDIIGEEGQGIWLIDQEIGKMLQQIKAERAAEGEEAA
ncbi:ferritin [Rhodoflexus caldus]|uniref:ferritin n=1 Tax=Rhodoflexus caldus TaxID=2891236 RepID=UPI002029B8AC|nr:ferritin [Rhodoflexus caldus]